MIDVNERDAFVLMLRSKTALGRLGTAEVHSVLDFLEGIGFANQTAVAQVEAEPEPAPVIVIETAPVVDAPVVAPPPEVTPAPVLTPPPEL